MNNKSQLLRQATRQSLLVFLDRMLPQMIHDFEHFDYIDFIGAEIEDRILGRKSRRLAINLPPRHGKSYIMLGAAAWYLGNFPEKEVLLATHSQQLANDLAGKFREILNLPLYKEMFPHFSLMPGRETVADFRTMKGGAFKAGGLDTNLTGRGADLLLIDDALSAQDKNSFAERNFVNETFDSMLATRLNNLKTGTIISMSHRLHVDDLTAHLKTRGFDHISLPFEALEQENYICGGVTYSRNKGDVLQPGRSSTGDLNVPSHVFATQYQQLPTTIGSGILKERHFFTTETCPSGGQVFISWDHASVPKDGRSYSVALVFRVLGSVAYLTNIFRVRMEYSELKKFALDLDEKFKPAFHLVEIASVGGSIAAELRQVGANVFDIKPTTSKEDRLYSVMHLLDAQFVRPVAGIPNLNEFFNECFSFPNGRYNDMVDALTQFLKFFPDIQIKPRRELIVMGAGHRKTTQGGNRSDAMERIIRRR